jgi:hypothetical protein
MEAASTLFYLVPGPKMLWQFGELGFDLSINRCENGNVNPPGAEGGEGDCRLSIKPPVWDYLENSNRYNLFQQTSSLIRMKKAFGVFQDGTATFSSDNLVKQVIIKNKNYTATPSDSSQMSAVVAANFDLTTKTVSVNFPHTGTWHNFKTGGSIDVTSSSSSVNIEPGTFFIFTNVEILNPLVTAIEEELDEKPVTIFPNPVGDLLETSEPLTNLSLMSTTGVRINLLQLNERVWDAKLAPPGFYIAIAQKDDSIVRIKIFKR